MKYYETENIKNIVLVGGAKAGKSTLAECMMFEGGVISRMGTIEDGNTVSDFHEYEQERQNSIFSTVMHTEWRGTKINIIDTPGLSDYIGQATPGFRVADTAVLLLGAQNGVDVGAEVMMRYLRKRNKPTIMAVNQIDHPKADFDKTLEEVRSQFSENVVLMQYPYNSGEGFDSIIDLLKMIMYKFSPTGGKPEKLPIPAEEKEKADELHNALVEAAAENDDSLMEMFFEKGSLDEDEMRIGLGKGIANRDLIPLFVMSAKKNMGSGRMMGFIGNVAPSPGQVTPETTSEGNEINVTDPDKTLFVFKTDNEKHAGTVNYFKVCSGGVSGGDDLHNNNSNSKVRLNQLYVSIGKNREAVDKLAPGDIGATVKIKDTYTNHTLRSSDDGVTVTPIQFPEPRIRTAVQPTKSGEEEKMGVALNKLHQSDPTIIMEMSKELKQTLLHAQGGLHLATIKWLLKHEHGVDIEYGKPKIPYRETIRTEAKADYKHKKQSGGSGQFGEVYLRIMPYDPDFTGVPDLKVRDIQDHELPWGGNLMFCSAIVGGSIDSRFLPAIMKGIMEVMEEGPLTSSYCRDVIVIVYDGKMHAVDSNEISFKIAGKAAFKKAFLEAKPMLLEPIYHVDVLVPDDYTGDVMTDLQGRRAMVEGIGGEGTYQKISARVPLAEMYQYANTLSSIAQGRAIFTREFIEYSQVPGDVQEKLVKSLMEAEPA